MSKYIIGIDQSTQGTKVLLFNKNGEIVAKKSKSHKQIINDKGWVSHDLDEIYNNLIYLIKEIFLSSKIDEKDILGVGISDQRETAAAWEKTTGRSLAPAIVWQDSRAKEITENLQNTKAKKYIKSVTGMELSPYFSAAKFSWLLKNEPSVRQAAEDHRLCLGTIDTWLLYRLTNGSSFQTEPSNASRTQIFDIHQLQWDKKICNLFEIPMESLAKISDSDSLFGYTDFEGVLHHKVCIHCILGDSQAALYGHGCWHNGDVKATIGTGSSVMMNIGQNDSIVNDIVTSIAWKINHKLEYVAEGNINYAGAVINWLTHDLKLINSADETERYALSALTSDQTYLIPAFSGLGAPYWDSNAKAALVGMTRTTGKNEVVAASLKCIAYQIQDILRLIDNNVKMQSKTLNVDGGVTANNYLMQFLSDITNAEVLVPNIEEFSAWGVALCAGRTLGIFNSLDIRKIAQIRDYRPSINDKRRHKLISGWDDAVKLISKKEEH